MKYTSLLMLLSVLGYIIMVESSDLLSIYLGLEIQSIGIYTLIATYRRRERSIEAAIKYFIYGGIASGIYLLGTAYYYKQNGTLTMSREGSELIIIAMLIKLGVVPFHAWVLDVFEATPRKVIAFISILPKLASLTVIYRMTEGERVLQWICLLSVLLGAVGGVVQTRVMRILGMSSIANMGLVMGALLIAEEKRMYIMGLYIIVYFVTILGLWVALPTVRLITEMRRVKREGLLRNTVIILLLSLAGIPPLGGFISKLELFKGMWITLDKTMVIGILLLTVVSAYYYVRISKGTIEGETGDYDYQVIEEGLQPSAINRSTMACCPRRSTILSREQSWILGMVLILIIGMPMFDTTVEYIGSQLM